VSFSNLEKQLGYIRRCEFIRTNNKSCANKFAPTPGFRHPASGGTTADTSAVSAGDRHGWRKVEQCRSTPLRCRDAQEPPTAFPRFIYQAGTQPS